MIMMQMTIMMIIMIMMLINSCNSVKFQAMISRLCMEVDLDNICDMMIMKMTIIIIMMIMIMMMMIIVVIQSIFKVGHPDFTR